MTNKTRNTFFVLVALVLTCSPFAFAQGRPTPGGPCLLGIGGNCPPAGTGATGTTTGTGTVTTTKPPAYQYPDVNKFNSHLHKHNANLYRMWIERERARYSYQHTGLASEAQRFQAAQQALEKVQHQHITVVREYHVQYAQALLNHYNSNPAHKADRARWEQAIQANKQAYERTYNLYQKLYGLRQTKFAGLPQTIFHNPETDKGVLPVLRWLYTP